MNSSGNNEDVERHLKPWTGVPKRSSGGTQIKRGARSELNLPITDACRYMQVGPTRDDIHIIHPIGSKR